MSLGPESITVSKLNLYGRPLLLDPVVFVMFAAFIFKLDPSHSILAPSGFPTKNLEDDPGKSNLKNGFEKSVTKLNVEPAGLTISNPVEVFSFELGKGFPTFKDHP